MVHLVQACTRADESVSISNGHSTMLIADAAALMARSGQHLLGHTKVTTRRSTCQQTLLSTAADSCMKSSKESKMRSQITRSVDPFQPAANLGTMACLGCLPHLPACTDGWQNIPRAASMSAQQIFNSSQRMVVCRAGPDKKPRTVDPVMQGIKDLVEAAAPTLAAISSAAGERPLSEDDRPQQTVCNRSAYTLPADTKPSTSGRASAPPAVKRSMPSTPRGAPSKPKASSSSNQQDSWLSPVYLIPLISAAVMAADASQLLPSFSHLALHLGRGFEWWQLLTAGFSSVPGRCCDHFPCTGVVVAAAASMRRTNSRPG
jgi:hypothetical protein